MVNRFILNEVSYFGPGARKELPGEIARLGLHKAFVASDKDLVKFGVTGKVLEVLDEAGIPYEVFSDIKPNPTVTNVKNGVEAFRKSGADFILAIGGGSSMDTSKAIGIITNNPEFSDVVSLEGTAPTKHKSVPIIALPTTAGTAAEVTINYVITDEKNEKKMVCVDPNDIPAIAIVDAELMYTLPKGLTAATGLDALTHAIEGLTTKGAWEMSDMFEIKAIEMINRYLETAVNEPTNADARNGMAVAQYIAGMAFSKHRGRSGRTVMAVDLATFSPKRILVCQLRQIGDVVLATPSIELLKRRYPDAEIHLLTEKKCAPLLEHNPHLGKVWALDKKVLSSLPQEIAWYWHVARTGYDLVVDFQQLPRCRWVVAFSGAPVRLSYTPPWYTRLLYTHSSDMLDGYSAMSKASVLRPLGIEWNGERPRVYLTDEEHAFARTLLAQAGLQPEQRLITLDPTHRQPTRRWPLAHYAGLVSLLAERDASLRFLPLWGPGEEAEIQELSRLCPAGSLLLPERMLSLREMAACIAEADLHIGNCSAPRHIAVAVGTPTLTVLGSTTPAWTFPSPEHADIALNLPCQHCNRNHCPDPRCLTGMLPGPVADKAMEMLKK